MLSAGHSGKGALKLPALHPAWLSYLYAVAEQACAAYRTDRLVRVRVGFSQFAPLEQKPVRIGTIATQGWSSMSRLPFDERPFRRPTLQAECATDLGSDKVYHSALASR